MSITSRTNIAQDPITQTSENQTPAELSQQLTLQSTPDVAPEPTPNIPIASETTNAGEQQTQRPNKYSYDVFAGYSGKELLDRILQQLLSYANWRTWHFADRFVAPGNDCYVGTYRLASEIRPGIRKVEMDLKSLRDQGLVNVYPDYRFVKQADTGKITLQAVIIKDFQKLYDLAYEYYQWENSPGYIPPLREYIPLILADEALTQKLLRFDNYRRLLCCHKPGRKSLSQGSQTLPSRAELLAIATEDAVNNPTSTETKRFSNGDEKSASPNRKSRNDQMNQLPVSISRSDLKKEEQMAIGRGSTELEQTTIEQKQPEQNSRKPEIQQTKQTPPKSQYTHMHEPEEATEPEQAKSKEIEIPTTAEATPEVAKGEKEYNIEDLKKNPVALATVLATMHTQSEGKSEDEPKQKQKRSRRGTPAQLARSIAYMVQQLGENPKSQQSDITRVTKFYYAASQIFTGFTNSWFLSQMQEAFTAAFKARGVKRRVPYFFVCLENILHLTLEEKAYIRTDEPLYSDSAIKDFMSQLRRSYERSGSDLAYHEWIKQNYHLS